MDIVEQCRKAKEYNLFDADVYEQAANEIERLREENKMMQYYLPENIDFVKCSEGKDHFNFEIVYKALGEKE